MHRRWSRVVGGAVVVGAALVGASTAAPRAMAGGMIGAMGLDANYVFQRLSECNCGTTTAVWDPYLNWMQSAGITVVRSDIGWNTVEPEPPSLQAPDFTDFDLWAQDLAAHGMRWEPIIDYSAKWASENPSNPQSPPLNDSDYATYAALVASRYGPGGAAWNGAPTVLPVTTFEIWNEENNSGFWGNGPCQPARYAGMFEAASTAIKDVDPTANVLIGGLVGTPDSQQVSLSCTDAATWIQTMNADYPNVLSYATGVALHPYAPTVYSSTSGTVTVTSQVARLRAALNGVQPAPEVPIYVNEVGWSTTGYPATLNVSEATRDSDITEAAKDLMDGTCDVAEFQVYDAVTPEGTWTKAGEVPNTSSQGFFGIIADQPASDTAAVNPYPSATDYKATITAIEGPNPPSPPDGPIC